MADYIAGNAGELASAIAAANASSDPVNTITLTASISLNADLPIIHPDAGSTIVIDGDGFTIDGNNAHRIFFADSGKLVLKDVTLTDGYAKGGDGGDGSSGGGGGMGAGGALFVNSTADVTIINVAFVDNAATGGDGGTGVLATGGGGGGGLGGDGGSAGFILEDHDGFDDTPGIGVFGGGGGGGGLGADGANGGAAVGDQDGGDGADGLALGQGDAGGGATANGVGGSGGTNGGGGGGGGAGAIIGEGGGGGGGGIDGGTATDQEGSNGGDFGGGGGGGGAAGGSSVGLESDVADGGFGGGGGGSGVVLAIFGGGQGGYGGGGGGESPLGLFGGTGGFGAGTGGSRLQDPDTVGGSEDDDVFAAGGGGGGAGFGGAIFVREGGKLSIGTTSVSGGDATGGNGGSALSSSVTGGDGQGAGSGLFLQGDGTLWFAPVAGQIATIADAIADEQGLIASGYTPPDGFDAGAWNVVMTGTGTLILSGSSTYAGETEVHAGRLQVDGSIAYSVVTNVESGATLGGNGRTGDVVVETGGMIGAGNSAGRLTTGDLSLTAGALFQVEIGGTVAGIGGYDQIAALGEVSLGNATLDISLLSGFAPAFGNSFVVVDNNGADAVTGTFAGLAEGAEFVAAGRAFSISYQGGDGNDVVLTAIQARIIGTSGNDLVNASNTVFGELPATDGDDYITGKDGNDKLSGSSGNDEIYGDNGKDKLFGDDGNDYLSGGNAKDKLDGGTGADTLDGGKGKDKLTGGADADIFLFSTKLQNKKVDKITDFGNGDDVFNLSQDIFTKLGPVGELSASQFHVGKAKGSDAQIVYKKSKGLLIYDKNGSKSGGDTKFAKVDKGTELHHDDFFVV